jgi:hypothetical protein
MVGNTVFYKADKNFRTTCRLEYAIALAYGLWGSPDGTELRIQATFIDNLISKPLGPGRYRNIDGLDRMRHDLQKSQTPIRHQ